MSQAPATLPAQTARRPSSTFKTNRRQFRSCDQCRRGKRACDVVLPEELPEESAQRLYPPDPCSSCARTSKTCTIEWLSSQLQSNQNKKQRSAGGKARPKPPATASTGGDQEQTDDIAALCAPATVQRPGNAPHVPGQFPPYENAIQQQLDISPTDFPFPVDISHDLAQFEMAANASWEPEIFPNVQETPYPGPGSIVESIDYGITPPHGGEAPSIGVSTATLEDDMRQANSLYRPRKKRRQRSPTPRLLEGGYYDMRRNIAHGGVVYSSPLTDPSSSTPEYRLAIAHMKSSISSGLVKIYHDSMENALSCWLTERTCPYVIDSRLMPNDFTNEWGPEWSNRICERVCHLDRVASGLRNRALIKSEEKAVDMALRKTIVAFAAQWAYSSGRSEAEFSDEPIFPRPNQGSWDSAGDFDRQMQESFWHEARDALRDTAEIPSFRVVFAHIIFSLTQRPLNLEEKLKQLNLGGKPAGSPSFGQERASSLGEIDRRLSSTQNFSFSASDTAPSPSTDRSEAKDADGIAQLEDILDLAGPPTFLETALRQIFSFRRKLDKMESKRARKRKKAGSNESKNASPLSPEDHQTFNMLFWLGVMFDTLSAAFNMRPLVVSDEDSDINTASTLDQDTSSLQFAVHRTRDNAIHIDFSQNSVQAQKDKDSVLWGDFLLKNKEKRNEEQQPIIRWPCSYNLAAEALCDAAPIKVLLFRKVTRLQTLLSRGVGNKNLELAIADALSINDYWNTYYDPFMKDCVRNHEDLPPRVQSWYVILCGHWHLAQFLLADTIEEIDEDESGLEDEMAKRRESSLVETLRRQASYSMSDLGWASCPRHSDSFPRAREFHGAVNKGALLTEPWTEVLVRSFSKAGSVLLDFLPVAPSPGNPGQGDFDEIRNRCNHCVEALWYLGKKSDIALLASEAIAGALERRVKSYNAKSQQDPLGSVGSFVDSNDYLSNFNFSNNISLDNLPGAYLDMTENEKLFWL